MSFKKASNKVVYAPEIRKAIHTLQYNIFGTLPNIGVQTGFQRLTKQHIGVYINRYYPDPIEKIARIGSPGYKSAQEERRAKKLEMLRRRGKGPPKKGAGGKKKN